ncbi:MAG: hypothetical protein K2X66_10205 [Cyanobacteria bacterium]|nr:hypothetical protein [Cyanobacteriota bacterium]
MKLAEAYGCQGFEIVDPASADEVIQKAYAIRDRPVIMNFRVQSKEDVYPWVPAGASNEEMLVKPG